MAEQVVSVSRVIEATPETIFEILTDPARHGEIDGSGMVQHERGASERLELGSKFGMDMKMGPIPYRVTNRVVEFDDNRLIAWCHFGKHRWRYELEPIDADDAGTTAPATRVTESFDWSTAISKTYIELAGWPKRHRAGMEATLERLADLVES